MKQIARVLVEEWKERILPEIIGREEDPTELMDWKIIKAIPIIGFRRVGKTYLLLNMAKKLGKENTLYIDFEDERIPQAKEFLTALADVVKEAYGRKKLVLLLDEIQNIPSWSRWIRRMLDTKNYQIFVSGSSSKLSSKEIPTELRGRCITIELYPLSFKEFLRFKGEKPESLTEALKLNLVREYLTFGGLPEIVLSDKAKKYLLIDEYFKTFLLRDVFERYKIRNKELMRELLRLMLNSSYLTLTKSFNILKSIGHKVGKETLANYFYYLESSLFIYFLEIFSPKIKNRLKAPRKIMFIDNFFIKRFSSKFSENFGKLMENATFLELKRRLKRPETEIFYWKDYQQREVDFVLKEGLRVKQLIQVTYASAKDEIDEREIKSLVKASELLKCKKLLCITWDYEDVERIKGKEIVFKPLWKLLLFE